MSQSRIATTSATAAPVHGQVKSLDRKLAAIHADPSGCREFILADAKDADMAFGIGAPGRSPETHAGELRFRSLAEYREQMRQIVGQGLVDIMLMSASSNEVLTIHERRFDNSPVTPAARVNDTTDIWVVRGGRYAAAASQPFRTATIDQIQCGRVACDDQSRPLGANLGLYSLTFNNRLEEDRLALEEYRRFRIEAEQRGFRHFLELFDPNAPEGLAAEQVPGFINDCVARTLAGVPQSGRPLFLKMVYHGPRALEELVAYDPHLVVGILGGAAGTTLDAFKLLSEARRYGARVALFGRKINGAENQLAFVSFLRLIADGQIEAEEAVRAYHGVLQRLGVRPHRSLEDDLLLQTNVMSYHGASITVPARVPQTAHNPAGAAPCACKATSPEHRAQDSPEHTCQCDAKAKDSTPAEPGHDRSGGNAGHTAPRQRPDPLPDFRRMTQAEKLAYNQARRDRIFG
jgi:hypothetical protein